MKTNCNECGHFKDNHSYGETTDIADKIGHCMHTDCDCESYEPTPERSVEENEHTRIHMKCLAKSKCAKDCGELTVIPMGFAVQIIKEELQTERQRCDEMVELGKREQVEYIENMRDHDSCECDNCHRWRKFKKNWDKRCKRLDTQPNNPK